MAENISNNTAIESEPDDLIKLQQEFYDLFGHRTTTIYDCYPSMELLEMKISLITPKFDKEKLANLVSILWEQRIFAGEKCLMMSPIFLCCVYDVNINGKFTHPLSIKSKRYTVHPLFRIMKCERTVASAPNRQRKQLCAVFVDEFGRVYENWEIFYAKNKFEDSLVISPANGVYNGNTNDEVILDVFVRSAGLTRALDVGTTVAGLASAGIGAAALIPAIAIAPAVVAGAAVVGVSCAVYSGARSIYDLFDRHTHKQSISLKDKHARASWINLTAGTFSIGAAGATQAITTAATNGRNISKVAQNAVHFVNIGAVSLHATGCLDGVHTLLLQVYNGENVSKLHLTQLSCSLFLLTHSVYNYRTAQQIFNEIHPSNPETLTTILREQQKTNITHLVESSLEAGIGFVGRPGIVIRFAKQMLTSGELEELIQKMQRRISGSSTPVGSIDTDSLADNQLIECLSDDIKIEYCRAFDGRKAEIISILQRQPNHGVESLKVLVEFFLVKLSFQVVKSFVRFTEMFIYDFVVQQSQIHFGSDILVEPIMKWIYEYLKLLHSLDDRRIEQFFNDIFTKSPSKAALDQRQQLGRTFESQNLHQIVEFEINFDRTNNLNDIYLGNERRTLLALIDRIDYFASKFEYCCVDCDKYRNETIEGILIHLNYNAADTFFDIAHYLIVNCRAIIQSQIGRFVPIDVLITDIFLLLKNISDGDINDFLMSYTPSQRPMIQEQYRNSFTEKYAPQQKPIECKSCGGQCYKA